VIRILAADDSQLGRATLTEMLVAPDFVVVAIASDGREALQLALEHRPDLLVLDINMPHMSGLDVARAVRNSLPQARIILYSAHDPRVFGHRDVTGRHNVHGFLSKSASTQEVVAAIRAVHSGELAFPYPHEPTLEPPTETEMAVLRLLATRMTLEEIAAQLGSREMTVRLGLNELYDKLGGETRHELVERARQQGLLP